MTSNVITISLCEIAEKSGERIGDAVKGDE
jgi:hypothetical protein